MPSIVLHILFGVTLGLCFQGRTNAEEEKKESLPTPAPTPAPLRILLVSGGAAHDYPMRAKILAAGIRERLSRSVQWSLHLGGLGHSDEGTILFPSANWATEADLVIHDYCFPLTKDAACVDRVIAPHLAGVPAVILHASTLSFSTDSRWLDFIGAQVRSLGQEDEITAFGVKAAPLPFPCPFPKKFRLEETYRLTMQKPGIEVFADTTDTDESEKHRRPLIWSHRYGPKESKVFVTTLGNSLTTLADPWFLDLVAQGILWAVNDSSQTSFVKIPPNKSLSKLGVSIPKEPIPSLGPNLMLGAALTISTWQDRSGLKEGSSDNASLAVDGDPNTVWIPATHGPKILLAKLTTTSSTASAALSWGDAAPKDFLLEGSADGLTWTHLADTHSTKATEDQVYISRFAPIPIRFLRLSIPVGGSWRLREIAIYRSEDEIPSAISARDQTKVSLHTAACQGVGQMIRLRTGWHLAAMVPLPNDVIRIMQIVPTASSDALLLLHFRDQNDTQKTVGRVYRINPSLQDELAPLLYRDKLATDARIAWDGERLYTLSAKELDGFRAILSKAAKNSVPHAKLSDLRLGDDGLLHAWMDTPGSGADQSTDEVSATAEDEAFGEADGIVKIERDGNAFWLVLEDSGHFYLALLLHEPLSKIDGTDWQKVPDEELASWIEKAQRPSIRREAVAQILRRKLDPSPILKSALLGEHSDSLHTSVIALADGLEGEQRLRWLRRFFQSPNLKLQIPAMTALARVPGIGDEFTLPELKAEEAPELNIAVLNILRDHDAVSSAFQDSAMLFSTNSNPALAKAAQRYLLATQSWETLFHALDTAESASHRQIFLALFAESRDPGVVHELIDRLNRATDPTLRGEILGTLVHLWGTKDQNGNRWSESERIDRIVQNSLKTLRIDRGLLLRRMMAQQMRLSDQGTLIALAKDDMDLEPLVISLLGQMKSKLAESTVQWLGELHTDPERDDQLRSHAGLLLGVNPTEPPSLTPPMTQSKVMRGRHLFQTLGCAVCHDIHGESETFPPSSSSRSDEAFSQNLSKWLTDNHSPQSFVRRRFEDKNGRIRIGWERPGKGDISHFIDRAGNTFALTKSEIACSWPADDILPDCSSGKSLGEDDFQTLIDYVTSMLR